ncbi:hypothetical protein COL940_006345 [Colletotrichum noveboracense]|nr:hypothetical protein COL940_006345 [Colletotrichum noveboracense]KAJ0287054.1 hypothetical protein CBS470a_005542 [Colletotrichum nupharicola]
MPRAQEERPQRLVKRYRTEIAASTSSMFSTVVAFPLDSVKTRMQTYRYEGFLDCVRHTYRTEKLKGFFRGVLAPMASVTLVRTISFSIYQRAKYTYSGWIKQACGFDVLQHVNKQGTYPNLYSIACFGAAGASAGSCITLLACPFELTKLSAQVSVLLSDQKKLAEANCRATNGHQVAASYQNKGTFKTMSNIIRHRGALGLYTGFNLHLYPIDSAKSIYQRNSLLYSKGQQVEPPPKIEFFKKHMYRGLGVSMGRSCAVNAIFFSAFEFMKKHVNSLDDN